MSSSIKDMTDEEVVEAITEALEEDGRVMTDYIKIEYIKGKPVLNGRVPSDDQIQIVDEILGDVLEVEKFENKLWVDDELSFKAGEEGDVEELTFGDEEDMESTGGYEGDDDE
jgi:hypothetical protein